MEKAGGREGEKGGRDRLEDEERQTERVGVEEESFPGGFLSVSHSTGPSNV